MAVPEEEAQEQENRFVIDDDDKACWALRKIKKLKNEIEEEEQLAERQINQINNWLEHETEKRKQKIEHLESLLFDYAINLKKRDPELKTHSLPFGELKFRKQRPKWKYDNKKLLKFLKTTGMGAIRVKESVDKKALKKIAKVVDGGRVIHAETGEIIEGVEVEERGEMFSVKVR